MQRDSIWWSGATDADARSSSSATIASAAEERSIIGSPFSIEPTSLPISSPRVGVSIALARAGLKAAGRTLLVAPFQKRGVGRPRRFQNLNYGRELSDLVCDQILDRVPHRLGSRLTNRFKLQAAKPNRLAIYKFGIEPFSLQAWLN